jgi:hypothetical protein
MFPFLQQLHSMLHNRARNGRPIGRRRPFLPHFWLKTRFVSVTLEEEHSNLALTPPTGVKVRRQVVGRIDPQLQLPPVRMRRLVRTAPLHFTPPKHSVDRTYVNQYLQSRAARRFGCVRFYRRTRGDAYQRSTHEIVAHWSIAGDFTISWRSGNVRVAAPPDSED